MLDEILTCGKCAWYGTIEIPEDKKAEVSPRGYCHYNPPTVFPLPQQKQSSLALAQGQTVQSQTQMVPLMMRPVVEEDENMCGRYQPNREMNEKIAKYRANLAAKDVGSCGGPGISGDPPVYCPPGGCGGCGDEGAKCEC